MAQQLAERYRVPQSFGDVEEMLRSLKPQIIHITTPPQSHFALARQCLDGGSHVYLEPLKIGPLSVGYRLLSDGVAFGRATNASDGLRRSIARCGRTPL